MSSFVYDDIESVGVRAVVLYLDGTKLYEDSGHTIEADYDVVMLACQKNLLQVYDAGSTYNVSSFAVDDDSITVDFNSKSVVVKKPIWLKVGPTDSGVTVLGKRVGDLQSGVTVREDYSISGTLKYVTGYTEFNASNPVEQEGNYLCLICEFPEGASATVELKGGLSEKGPVAIDEDRMALLRISKPTEQQVEYVVTKDDQTITRMFTLNSLILEDKHEDPKPVIEVED